MLAFAMYIMLSDYSIAERLLYCLLFAVFTQVMKLPTMQQHFSHIKFQQKENNMVCLWQQQMQKLVCTLACAHMCIHTLTNIDTHSHIHTCSLRHTYACA